MKCQALLKGANETTMSCLRQTIGSVFNVWSSVIIGFWGVTQLPDLMKAHEVLTNIYSVSVLASLYKIAAMAR